MPSIPAPGQDIAHMRHALELASTAAVQGEVPVGAIVINAAGEVIGRGANARIAKADATAHAEIIALREATQASGSSTLEQCTLVVTLEPCVMCAGAILSARVPRVVFGAWDDKAGAAGSVYDLLRDGRLPSAIPEVIGGVLADECADVLRTFFETRRVR